MTPSITVSKLVYEYPTQRALDHVSFQLPKGSITALVGPNGAGKTTLLKCLAGLETPLSGTIQIQGIDVIEDPRKCHEILGFLPDSLGLYEDLTVEQSLIYFAEAHGIEATSELLEWVMGKVDLLHKRKEKSGTLSRGMRQRLAIGQTIIFKPQVLLLDEPASGLDPEARIELAELFKRLNADGTTLVVSSHILAELQEYANHLVILREGKIVQSNLLEPEEGETVEIEVRLLKMTQKFQNYLKKHKTVSEATFTEELAKFRTPNDPKLQQKLLAEFMSEGFLVYEFSVRREGIQDKYLKTIRNNG